MARKRGRHEAPAWGGSAAIAALAVLAMVLMAAFAFVSVRQKEAAQDDPPPGYTASTGRQPVRPVLNVPKNPQVLIVGDSFAQGFGAQPETKGYAYQLVDRMRWKGAIIDGIGGTGFVDGTPAGGPFAERIKQRIGDQPPTPDLVILQGSINDVSKPRGQLIAAARDAVLAVRKEWPEAQVLVIGPMNYRDYSQVSDAYEEATVDTRRTFYVPWDVTKEWLPQGGGNYAPDGFHPSTEGHGVLAEKFADEINYLESHTLQGREIDG